MSDRATLQRLAEAINRRHQAEETTISAVLIDVDGVPAVNLFDHFGRRISGRPVDAVWHVAADQPLPGNHTGRASTACFVWGPCCNWSAATVDVEAAARQVVETAEGVRDA
jgi:hypothetical protein